MSLASGPVRRAAPGTISMVPCRLNARATSCAREPSCGQLVPHGSRMRKVVQPQVEPSGGADGAFHRRARAPAETLSHGHGDPFRGGRVNQWTGAGRLAGRVPATPSPGFVRRWCMDLEVSPALTIPAAELRWRFSRSSGPGGQHVNTSDSRAELSWNVADSMVLSDGQRLKLTTRLEPRLVAGVITVTASEQRSQLRNREIALAKLAGLVAEGLAPAAPRRRATKPTRGSNRRRLAAKEQRSATKQQRRRPSAE